MEKTRLLGDRSQSDLVAVVLLVGMVSISAVVILMAGGIVVDDTKQEVESDRVENAFRETDADIDSVAYGNIDTRSTEMDLQDRQGGVVEKADTGRMTVTLGGPGVDTEIINTSLGAITYRDGETTYGYQSTGVWQGTDNGTQMLSAPGIEYKDQSGEPTLKLLATRLEGSMPATTNDVVYQRGPNSPRRNDVRTVAYQAITIRIESQFYVGWADYFQELLGDRSVTVDHTNETAIVRAFPSALYGGLPAGIVQTTDGENLVFDQTFGTDAYNSSIGPYSDPASQTDDGKVIAEGSVELNNQAEILGSVVAGEEIDMGQDSRITQNATTGTKLVLGNGAEVDGSVQTGKNLTFNSHKAKIQGDAKYGQLVNNTNHDVDIDGKSEQWSETPATDMASFPAVDGVITTTTEAATISSDNDETSAVQGDSLNRTGCSGGQSCTITLTAGTYYLQGLTLDAADTLVLNTSDGAIDLIVDGRFEAVDASIQVEGSQGRVNVFVNSSDPSQDDVLLVRTDVSIPGDEAPRFWMYVDHEANVLIEGGGGTDPKVDGVIFGPAVGASDGADIRIRTGAEVFGAVVGDVNEISQYAGVHFDKALMEDRSSVGGVPPVKWLHVLLRVVEIHG